jgi:4-carboxymuconolactone decarboxylase
MAARHSHNSNHVAVSARANAVEHGLTLHPKFRAMVLATVAGALNSKQTLSASIHEAFKHGATHRELYEALLQLYLFAGFPAALESLSTLAEVMQQRSEAASNNALEPYNIANFTKRGEELCQRIYTSTYQKMRQNLGRITPDLDAWMIVEGYGKTLSREGVDTKSRELLIVATLAALGWTKQLYSHLRGAMNVGATSEECRAVLAVIVAMIDDCRTVEQEQSTEEANTNSSSVNAAILHSRYEEALKVLSKVLSSFLQQPESPTSTSLHTA